MASIGLEDDNIGDFYNKGQEEYFDKEQNIKVVKLYSGDCYVTKNPNEMVMTILGSCISACIRDPILSIGGMNHFLLPENQQGGKINIDVALRYGSFAMEMLVNSIIKMGGVKERLEVKLFGGANVGSATVLIGSRNVEFIKEYVKNEKLHIMAEHLGGTNPRRVHYYPATGKVMMKQVKTTNEVLQEEMKYQKKLSAEQVQGGDAELF